MAKYTISQVRPEWPLVKESLLQIIDLKQFIIVAEAYSKTDAFAGL